MIESRSDFLLRILDEVSRLTVGLAGMKSLGLVDEALRELETLEQEAGRLDLASFAKVQTALAELRRAMEETA